MARTLLFLSFICSLVIVNSCRSLYNNISDKIQTGLSTGFSAAFDPCNKFIIDSVANTLLIGNRDSSTANKIETEQRMCSSSPDTIKLTQVDKKTHSLYIRRTSFDSLNYKIVTFSNFHLIQNSDTNINVKINYIFVYKSTAALKDKKDTTGYKMHLILTMQGKKRNN